MLESRDLLLLTPQETDPDALADYYQRNRAFLAPFEPVREEAFFTPQHQRTLLLEEGEAAAARRSYVFYLALKAEPRRIIGLVRLSNVVWGAFLSAHLGYKLDEACLNRGLMTQAVARVSEYAFKVLGLHRLEANVMPRNLPSLRVLQKCGFQPEGLARQYLKINGVWEDHLHNVLLSPYPV